MVGQFHATIPGEAPAELLGQARHSARQPLYDRGQNEEWLNQLIEDATPHRMWQTVFIDCDSMHRGGGPEHLMPIEGPCSSKA